MTENNKTLIHFLVDADLLRRLDDFRFTHRFVTRAEAIRWLLEWALQQNPTPKR